MKFLFVLAQPGVAAEHEKVACWLGGTCCYFVHYINYKYLSEIFCWSRDCSYFEQNEPRVLIKLIFQKVCNMNWSVCLKFRKIKHCTGPLKDHRDSINDQVMALVLGICLSKWRAFFRDTLFYSGKLDLRKKLK